MKEERFKRVDPNHKVHIKVGKTTFGDSSCPLIAGPCAVESIEQIRFCAEWIHDCGLHMLRGGCFKPRTSPYSFQGLELQALKMLRDAADAFGLSVVTEVPSTKMVEPIAELSDMIQIGARNMQNFDLLRAVGRIRKPVILKRNPGATVEEFLYAAEYILNEGNADVVLCERGIRTFETSTRYTLDLCGAAVIKSRSSLPLIVDPSHAAGRREFVPSLARAARAFGCDGVMVEFHPNPEQALSDGPQSLTPEALKSLATDFGFSSERALSIPRASDAAV